MSDQDGDNKTGSRGRAGGGGGRGGSVRQSFSHGRSKAVVVEKKRKRIIPQGGAASNIAAAAAAAAAAKASAKPVEAKAPPVEKPIAEKPAEAPKPKPRVQKTQAPSENRRQSGGKGRMLNTLTEDEAARRLEAIRRAQKDEVVRKKREAEDDKRREAESKRRVEEAEEKARAVEEETKRVEAEAEEVKRREEEETRAAEAEKAREAAKAQRAATAPATPDNDARPARGDDDRRGGGGRGQPAAPRNKPTPSRSRDDGRRRSGKLTITQALSDSDGGRQRSLAAMRRRQEREKRKLAGGTQEREKVVRDVVIPEAITVQELANRMAERVADVIKSLMKMDVMATQNQSIDQDTAELIVEEFGHKVRRVSESDVEDAIETTDDVDEELTPRAPVVTIMGHVDHGKTSILDALRKTNVVAGEAGGITQHIGAYQVTTDQGAKVTFLDTPGHAAFTSMRARGANVTDIVILVVAADDSVMPQTIEAINHAKAADVPMIIAINKMDREGADPNKVRTELLQHEVLVEAMSGDVLDVECSAISGLGLDTLMENIVLQSELQELRANPNRAAEGAVIEAKLDTGRGPVATVLVQRGTLRTGDIFVVGEQWGKVRALVDDQGDRVKEAGPSVPVEVLGLNGTPEAGDVLNVVEDEAKAREIADYRQRSAREKQAAQGARATLDQLLAQAQVGDVSELPVLVKADVQGSSEAIIQALEKIGNDEVKVRVLHSGVGAITESDVTLAEASNAPIIGFNVRANAPARTAANQKGVEIRYYSIIYDLVDDVKAAASGLLSAEVREKFIGYAKIQQVFKVTGVGKVAGCMVTEGVARRSAGVRLLRDNVVIHEGTLKTLKRFKDEVKEVQVSQECGMAFENYEDIRENDVIEIFEREEVERTL